MAQDVSIPRQDPETGLTVLEWGERTTAPGVSGWLRRRFSNRRLAQVAGGFGAGAGFAAMVNEWTVTLLPDFAPNGTTQRVSAGMAEVGAFGTGYLIGLLSVVGSLALSLYGSPAARHNARVVGLAAASVLLALLVAAAVTLDKANVRIWVTDDEQPRTEFGPGLTLAFAAAALLGSAVALAGRGAGVSGRDEIRATEPPGIPAESTSRGGVADPESEWVRPPRDRDDPTGENPRGPIDITVNAARPIVRPSGDHGDGLR